MRTPASSLAVVKDDEDDDVVVVTTADETNDFDEADEEFYDAKSSNSSPFTSVPPPGAEKLTAWLAQDYYYFAPAAASGGGDDDSGELGAVADHQDNMVEQEEDPAVRAFVGPYDNRLIQQLRRRRRRMEETSLLLNASSMDDESLDRRHNTSSSSAAVVRNKRKVPYQMVSYNLPDTPVWHNYTLSLQKQGPRPITYLRQCMTCGKQRKKRQEQSNNKRSTAAEVDGIKTFQADAQFVTRLVLICVGFAVSVAGFCISQSSEALLETKVVFATQAASQQQDDGDLTFTSFQPAKGFVLFVTANLLFGLIAFLPVAYRPVSAGSGIAEAKAVLNGIVLPNCTELQTALCKALSVTFAGAASLPVGLEGPMIFLGLSLGENSQRFLPSRSWPTLKTDRARRDFAAIGTASGVTAAFFAPIGGVLFAMEEGSSFWSILLCWRSFAAACVTAILSFVWTFLLKTSTDVFDVDTLGKFNGIAGQRPHNEVSFHIYDYLVFAGMGIIGGVLGACWCEVNSYLASVRRRFWNHRPLLQCGEVLVLVAVTSTLIWWLPHVYRECSPLEETKANDEFFRQFGCPPGEYNHLATLLLNPPGSTGINLLFWEPASTFSAATCLLAGTLYLCLLLLLFGTTMSMGIFIPLLYVGAAYGRALGVLLNLGDQCRTYAIVGSVAMLGGVVRVLISLTVIMVTTTDLPYFLTPFMVATLCAKVAGTALFGKDGIYDIILHLKQIPFLEAEPPKAVLYRGLRAKDIMSPTLVTLQAEQPIGTLLECLKAYPSLQDFVVTDPSRLGAFLGIVSREDILAVLSHRELFLYDSHCHENRKALSYQDLVHPHYDGPTIQSVETNLAHDDLERGFVDLTPYVEIAHYTFHMLGSVERAFELVRTLGLRMLVVTDANKPVGVITRHELKLLEELEHAEHGAVAAAAQVAPRTRTPAYHSIS